MSNEEELILTAPDVEKQLVWLSKELHLAQKENADVEMSYSTNKAELEIAMAKTRLDLADKSKPNGKNYTVDERADNATRDNQDIIRTVAIDEARIKASRARIQMLIARADIARSLSSSVKSSMK